MTFSVPVQLIEWLRTRTRNETIDNHRVLVNLDWWNRQPETASHSVTGTLDDGSLAVRGKASISRGELFRLAPGPEADPLQFLWPVIAWGTGTRHRLNLRRIQAVYQDRARAEKILRIAIREASESARQGYLSMRGPRNTNALKYVGPAFFTKLLYFAGAGNPDHPCLIVDERVLATLKATSCTDDRRFYYKYGYPVATYEAAVGVLQTWATVASDELGRKVGADEVERWAFETSGRLV
ncbi:hypothetical protein [Pseudarthrobacter sulfonivorans]|uniref:8-oxoguanine DNA glycosylase OGG fold protein n=1 Tax=Pseudarthrobacter sulfonivorans TaxID=121292 RepID=UPI0031DB6733